MWHVMEEGNATKSLAMWHDIDERDGNQITNEHSVHPG